jgi:hypothetical protein
MDERIGKSVDHQTRFPGKTFIIFRGIGLIAQKAYTFNKLLIGLRPSGRVSVNGERQRLKRLWRVI